MPVAVVAVRGRLAGQGHHDPGRPPRAHGTEDVARVGIKDVVAAVEGAVGRVEVPRSGVPTQRCQHIASGLHLSPDVGLSGRQGRGAHVHQVVLQRP